MMAVKSVVLPVAILASLATVVLTKPLSTGVGPAMSRLQAWNGFVSQLEMLQTAIPERLYSRLVADLLQALSRADTGALQKVLQAAGPHPSTDGNEEEGPEGFTLLGALRSLLQEKRTSHRRKHHTQPEEDEETKEIVGLFDRLTSEAEEDKLRPEDDVERRGTRTKRMVEVLLSSDRERESARQEETEVERMIRRLVAEASGMILYTLMSDSLAELQDES